MFLDFVQVVTDEEHLKLMGLLSLQAQSIQGLASALNLTERAVAEHISNLHEFDLIDVINSTEGRIYRLNTKVLADIKRNISLETQEENDTTWIAELGFAEWEAKILRGYTMNQRLTYIPHKPKKFDVVMRWLVTHFEADRRYTEAEINEIIAQVNPDFATLRRGLVDYGYLGRASDGSQYWVDNHV